MTPTVDIFSAQAAARLMTDTILAALLTVGIALAVRLVPGLSAARRSLIWTALLALILALSVMPSSSHAAGTTLHLDSRWSLVLILCWAVASLFRAAQLIVAARHLHQLSGKAIPVQLDPETTNLLRRAGRTVTVCTSPAVHRPCLAGFRSPRILLPPTLLAELTPAELHQVLLHETEHLRRGDDWINLAQKLALVLFPLNPALLWLEHRLSADRELACDDQVLRLTKAPKAYASCLARIAQLSLLERGLALTVAFLSARTPELTRRVQHILAPAQPARTPVRSFAAAGTLATATLAAAFAFHPQLVSFLPIPQASTEALASLPPVVPEAVSQPATFREPLHPTTALKPAKTHVAHPHKRVTTPLIAQAEPSPVYAPATPFFVTLTAYHPAARKATLYPDTPDTSRTYAALPYGNGWLLIQL